MNPPIHPLNTGQIPRRFGRRFTSTNYPASLPDVRPNPARQPATDPSLEGHPAGALLSPLPSSHRSGPPPLNHTSAGGSS